MSSNLARTHTHVSNRKKRKEEVADRKTVIKGVLDNPFRIKWPSIPENMSNAILAHVLACLEGLSDFRRDKALTNRKRKRVLRMQDGRGAGDEERAAKRRKHDGEDAHTADVADSTEQLSQDGCQEIADDGGKAQDVPTIMTHITVGINAVTRRLEAQIRDRRRTTVVSADGPVTMSTVRQPPIRLVFVCRADVDPPLLVSHIPYLVATWNSQLKSVASVETPFTPIKLIPFHKGSEFSLAEASGLRRVAVLAFDEACPGLNHFQHLLDAVPTLSASWLSARDVDHSARDSLIPTSVKQLKTSAPKNMKAAKEERAKERAVAKEKRRNLKQQRNKTIKISGQLTT